MLIIGTRDENAACWYVKISFGSATSYGIQSWFAVRTADTSTHTLPVDAYPIQKTKLYDGISSVHGSHDGVTMQQRSILLDSYNRSNVLPRVFVSCLCYNCCWAWSNLWDLTLRNILRFVDSTKMPEKMRFETSLLTGRRRAAWPRMTSRHIRLLVIEHSFF